MEKELPLVMLEDNYGAQYQNYFLSIALTNPWNKFFVYENYLELSIKHEYDNHIDYAFDGIYTCDRGIMNKFIIRGPVRDLHTIVRKSIDDGFYVVININEQFLPNRQAYRNHYFRHDLLIIGYDDEKSQYITVGFDADMQYSKVWYDFRIVEEAYYRMQSEWDFELFVFRFNHDYNAKLDKAKIKKHLENYCEGKNPNGFYFDEFLKDPSRSIEFVNNNYVGDYYGINVYDYLIDRLKKQYKLLGRVKEEDKLSVLDLRSLNTLRTHSIIIKEMLKDLLEGVPEEIITTLEKIEKTITGVKILVLKYFSDGEKKGCKKAVERLKRVKMEELEVIRQSILYFK